MSTNLDEPQLQSVCVREHFLRVRQASLEMCRPLEPAEFRIQPMDDASPPWWNLGHTSWFFVRNALIPFGGEVDPRDQPYDYLLNSYYASLGDRLPRHQRGLVTRPTTEEVLDYRASVDRRVLQLLDAIDDDRFEDLASVLRIGMEHEQQHQELFFTEILSILAQNPRALRRAYDARNFHERDSTDGPKSTAAARTGPEFLSFAGGLFEFGHLDGGWCWDNELPVHQQYLEPFSIAQQLVTNAAYLEFIEDDGYRNQLLWLDNGWQYCQEQQWQGPLYWEQIDHQWLSFSLAGLRPLLPNDPVSHVSFYEADAFARWKSENYTEDRLIRLPSEREWERAARTSPHFRDLHRVLWQWTASYYEPYPGYRPFGGALAEYNGKFMDNQRVLRGGSFATPADHYRLSYRNFWPAATRFQFTGIRLAREES